jgi:hypothetical protein
MLYLKLSLQILAIIIALLINFLDYDDPAKSSRFKNARKLLLAFTIIFLIVSLLVTYSDEQTKQKEADDLKTQLSTLKEQSETLKHSVTGGDSFCYLQFESNNNPTRGILLMHKGKYPLYDIQVRIVDLEIYRQLNNSNLEKSRELFEQAEKVYKLPTLNPNTAEILGKFTFPDNATEKNFNIFILARNGSFEQFYRFRKVKQTWFQAHRVIIRRDGKMEVLHQQIDQQFPTNKNGEIVWE